MGESAVDTDVLQPIEVSYIVNCSFDDFLKVAVSRDAPRLETTFYASFDNPFFSKSILQQETDRGFLPTLVLRGRYVAAYSCHDMPLSGLRFLDPDADEDLADVVAKAHSEAALRMHETLEAAGKAGIQQFTLKDKTILGRSVLFYSPDRHYSNSTLVEDAVKAHIDGLGKAHGKAKNYLVLEALGRLR
ncbi:hypothetical protein KY363_03810 [Candidatus Woesearchaeota archaeon]|nr:hypothetical protein [Candidatus Woesearchaeota archaeon]